MWGCISMGRLGGMWKMLLMHMHVGNWLDPLKFKVSKNCPSEAASYPVWSVLHSGSLWKKSQFTVHAPWTAETPGALF